MTFLDSLRNLIPAMPQLAPATGGLQVQFASSGGGGGRDDDDYPDDDFYEEELPEEDEPAPRRERRQGRRPTAARQRTVQTDPDERYWTDYLRIALPVIGLLLVIAVFWYWAQQLIDSDSEDLSPTAPGLAEVVDTPAEETEAPGTPTPPAGNILQPQAGGTPSSNPLEAFPSPTPTGQQPAAQQQQPPPSTPTEEPATTGAIAPDSTVTVVEDVNLRSEPTAQTENIVVVLPAGTELTVLSGPEESESYVWWQVVDPATGNQGWVVEEFIQPAA